MGTDEFHKKRKSSEKRKKDIRNIKPKILIVCEGEKTEPNYFKAFRITSVQVQVIGTRSL
ncbi:RloB domain-containing protein [Geotoga petraea]|jgi:hypothetical protein|uniref:RloB domain-containing protein n=1 Tax=Geotoga petraea TaxID=28234 RepID=A0A4Z0W4B4_9BACT|nr:RloB domain-containing protein [Geotoga petraea]TGG87894.1 RloB domain-containing protein [Geotoga petraea]